MFASEHHQRYGHVTSRQTFYEQTEIVSVWYCRLTVHLWPGKYALQIVLVVQTVTSISIINGNAGKWFLVTWSDSNKTVSQLSYIYHNLICSQVSSHPALLQMDMIDYSIQKKLPIYLLYWYTMPSVQPNGIWPVKAVLVHGNFTAAFNGFKF